MDKLNGSEKMTFWMKIRSAIQKKVVPEKKTDWNEKQVDWHFFQCTFL